MPDPKLNVRDADFFITQEQFQSITGSGYWKINDLPHGVAKEIRKFLGEPTTIGVFGSGLAPDQSRSSPIQGAFDRVRHELKPDQTRNEPEINIDHFYIGPITPAGYPVYGPYKDGAIGKHWSQYSELDVYDLEMKKQAEGGQ